jgi:hypothetical protein
MDFGSFAQVTVALSVAARVVLPTAVVLWSLRADDAGRAHALGVLEVLLGRAHGRDTAPQVPDSDPR